MAVTKVTDRVRLSDAQVMDYVRESTDNTNVRNVINLVLKYLKINFQQGNDLYLPNLLKLSYAYAGVDDLVFKDLVLHRSGYSRIISLVAKETGESELMVSLIMQEYTNVIKTYLNSGLTVGVRGIITFTPKGHKGVKELAYRERISPQITKHKAQYVTRVALCKSTGKLMLCIVPRRDLRVTYTALG